MEHISLKAHAKVNLALDVVRRREDGYHEVRMIMQTIGLHDSLEMKRERKPGIRLQTNLSYLPTDASNLVYRAADLLMKEFRISEGISIRLNKRIPVAAGMAGGSTDAAAALYGMNRLFELGLTEEQLMERGAKLGADVPYCLMRGTALAEGIGEILTPLPPMVRCPILIAKPKESVSTQFVYQNLKLDETTVHPDVDGMIASLEAKDLQAIAQGLGNVLETVTIPHCPVIAELKERMRRQGALNALMSGSGPTVFGLFESEETAQLAYEDIKSSGLAKQTFVTSIYNVRRR